MYTSCPIKAQVMVKCEVCPGKAGFFATKWLVLTKNRPLVWLDIQIQQLESCPMKGGIHLQNLHCQVVLGVAQWKRVKYNQPSKIGWKCLPNNELPPSLPGLWSPAVDHKKNFVGSWHLKRALQKPGRASKPGSHSKRMGYMNGKRGMHHTSDIHQRTFPADPGPFKLSRGISVPPRGLLSLIHQRKSCQMPREHLS